MQAFIALFGVAVAFSSHGVLGSQPGCRDMDCARSFVESGRSDERVRKLLLSPNIYIARAATNAFAYTVRPPADFIAVLEQAKARKIFNEDDFYGALARTVHAAPHPLQLEMLSRIQRANNAYAISILAGTFSHPSSLPMLGHDARRALELILLQNEPNFEQALGALGMTNMADYSTWLNSLALLQSGGNEARYQAIVLAALDAPRTDARKVMGFLYLEHGDRLIKAVGSHRLANAIQRIAAYSDSLPQQEMMREIVTEVRQRVSRAGAAGRR